MGDTPVLGFNEWLVSKIRKFLRDEPRRNKLLNTYEHSDEEICDAIVDVLEHYNTTPPPLNKLLKVEDYPSIHLMTLGCAIFLLRSESFLRARNDLQYNDDKLAINDDAKWQPYLQMVDRMDGEFQSGVKELKATINLENAFRGQSSPYSNLYDSYKIYSSLRK